VTDIPDPFNPSGLSEIMAAERLRTEGFNALPRDGRRTLPRILADVLREPMLALLLGAGGIYMALGDFKEALVLVAFAGLSVVITVVQETRTERALEALRDLTSPRALVIRGGVRRRIAGREVVRGDLVVLSEGDRVPADGWVAQGQGLQLDESLLTGESVPVTKVACGPSGPGAPTRPGGDGLPFVYAGALVVRGSGLCVVTATGPSSEIGRIGRVLATLEPEAPRLQVQTRRLVLGFAAAGLGASLLATLLYGFLRGGWLEAALAGIALGMSMLPEEFPLVLTIFLAMGAMRMSRERVLTRRAAAIETLGAATTLCTDKTGTLTENRMRIEALRLADGRMARRKGGGDFPLAAGFRELAELGVLASAPEPVDPMEVAFHQLAGPQARQNGGRSLVRHYPLDPLLLAMTQVWDNDPAGGDRLVTAKGAPEAIAGLCGLSSVERAGLKAAVDALAGEGLRVLGVAEARWPAGALPDSQRDFPFVFRGLVGLADPLRASVPEAVRQCRAAGVRVIMITGDHPQTARAIARQAGIDADDLLTGDDMAALDDAGLQERIRTVGVCARIMPEQKLRLVEALKSAGEIVAMTGDGVNDAPSLKAAHIGVAMGGRGADVAREASSLVLLDDDFGSIVRAIRMGRRIYDNLRKAMGFIVAAHIPIAGLALLPLLTGMPILLGPFHIAFLEMIIDPVCALAFEAESEEGDAMKRKPRPPETALFSLPLVGWAAVQGLLVLAVSAGLTVALHEAGAGEGEVRAAAFLSLVLGILALILVNRRFSTSLASAVRRPNPALAVVLAMVTGVLAVAFFLPPAAELFGFSTPGPWAFAAAGIAALVVFIVLERLKPVRAPPLAR
jgi:Ca2+-transporting ATPase